MNYVRLGTAVINVGNNLHLILPEGAFPVTPSSGPVTSVLTPIGRVQMSPSTVTQTCHPPAVTSTQRCRTPTAVLIPALARKPSPTPAFALAHSSPASFAAPPPAVHSAVKVRSKKLRSFNCWCGFRPVSGEIIFKWFLLFSHCLPSVSWSTRLSPPKTKCHVTSDSVTSTCSQRSSSKRRRMLTMPLRK